MVVPDNALLRPLGGSSLALSRLPTTDSLARKILKAGNSRGFKASWIERAYQA
jgi:hypothetical protein